MLSWIAQTMMNCQGKVRFFYQDETRLGLKTISGRKITAKGVKPRGKVQWQFKATYLYGVVEPETGENFCLVRVPLSLCSLAVRLSAARGRIRFFEFSHLNSQCFQIFLELVSQTFPDDLLVIQLDNGGFHKAKKLKVPNNIILMFQPPHCPESNAIEQVWSYLKRGLRWKTPADLDELRTLITHRLLEMTNEVIASITGRAYVLEALSVVNI